MQPFFRDHFARLDRQIVLIDALSAINSGPAALLDLQHTMEGVLRCFRPGANTLLTSLVAPRIDRLLFAATKADHLHHTSHDRLEAILRLLADQAIARASFAGAEVKVMALAALRATREAEARSGWQRLPCIVGVPLPGERLGRKSFDGAHRGRRLSRRSARGSRQPAEPDAARCNARQRAFPALPPAARQPGRRRPATRRHCRTSASTAPSTSCSETD